MKKMRMCFPREKTFVDGFAEYILDCKARNLREGTINHYRESLKQIYKRIPPDTPISSRNQQTIEGLLLNRHIMFFKKLFQFPPLHNAVSACIGFKVLFQQ